MTDEGESLVAAATCAPVELIQDMFKTLLRVRQAHFAVQKGYKEANAWNTDAAEPGVDIDIGRELTEDEFQKAFSRWRNQWALKLALTPEQQRLKDTISPNAFNKKVRTWFEAWLNNWLGNRHVARAIIRYGLNDPEIVHKLREAITKETRDAKDAEKRKHASERSGAIEPAWKLRRRALECRKSWREGQRLRRKSQERDFRYDSLSQRQKKLLDDFLNKTLHKAVDTANRAYGHGIARTSDFGFKPGDNMNQDVPTDVRAHRAHLRWLRTFQ